jgi:hypothetical protein
MNDKEDRRALGRLVSVALLAVSLLIILVPSWRGMVLYAGLGVALLAYTLLDVLELRRSGAHRLTLGELHSRIVAGGLRENVWGLLPVAMALVAIVVTILDPR